MSALSASSGDLVRLRSVLWVLALPCLLVALCSAAWASAGPVVRLSCGFEGATLERWRYIRADLHNPAEEPKKARLVLRYASGREERWALEVGALARDEMSRFVYEGAEDRLVGVTAELAGEQASWERPTSIPPSRPVVVMTQSAGRFLPLEALLSAAPGVVAQRLDPAALPPRWMAWRGAAAIVVYNDELPLVQSEEGEALEDYVRAGGMMVIYGSEESMRSFDGLTDGSVLGRGRVYRVGGARTRLPVIGPPLPPAPEAAPMLVEAGVAPPLEWLFSRLAWYGPAVLLAFLGLRRSVGLGLLLFGLILTAVWHAPPPPELVQEEANASWTDGRSYARAERLVVPRRSGEVSLGGDVGGSVVALDSGRRLQLSWDEEDGYRLQARWGEPVRLLVEKIARAD